ncbi:hypothetical protein BJX64DRAFT_87951 [Aspergillus heterothallicus]
MLPLRLPFVRQGLMAIICSIYLLPFFQLLIPCCLSLNIININYQSLPVRVVQLARVALRAHCTTSSLSPFLSIPPDIAASPCRPHDFRLKSGPSMDGYVRI